MKELYRKMKKANRLNFYLIGLITIAVGLGVLFLDDEERQNLTYYFPHKDMNKIAAEELEAGKWYNIDINEIYGDYASSASGVYYIIPIKTKSGEDTYMGLQIYNEDKDIAEEIYADTIDAINNDYELSSKHLKGVGRVETMSPNEASYFRYYFDSVGAPKDVTSKLVCKTVVLSPREMMWSKSRFMICSGVGCILFGLICILIHMSGLFLIKFKIAMKRLGVSETDLSTDYSMAKNIGGKVLLGNKYIICLDGCALLRLEDFVWIYPRRTTVNYVQNFSVMVHKKNRMKKQINMNSEDSVKILLQEIYERVPYVFVGYEKELVEMSKKDFKKMLSIVEERKKDVMLRN